MAEKNSSEKIIAKILGAPSDVLVKTIKSTEQVAKNVGNGMTLKKAGEYWNNLGPGLTTGAADDDPSGIATYSQAGARYGFSMLWLAAFTFPLMGVIQEMCARIGLVTGRGLAANIRRHYPAWVLYTCAALLFVANTFNIGANLGAMAKASQLLFPNLSFVFLIALFAVGSLIMQIFISYGRYSKYLKWLTLFLLSYVLTALSLEIDWHKVIKSALTPNLTFNREQIFMLCAILGTTISPYLFFWQTSQEVEEQILEGKTTIKQREAVTTDREIKKMRVDNWTGMFFSNLVMFFIIVTCAATLFNRGVFNIQTADQAASALKPLAGHYAYLLFTLGIIGTGLLAVPVLAGSASYALSESFGWKYGLYRKLKQAGAFYGVIIVSMLLGLLMNFIGLDTIKALIYSAILNGLVAPIILVLIVRISSDKKIMNGRANGKLGMALGWFITIIMILVACAAIAGFMFP